MSPKINQKAYEQWKAKCWVNVARRRAGFYEMPGNVSIFCQGCPFRELKALGEVSVVSEDSEFHKRLYSPEAPRECCFHDGPFFWDAQCRPTSNNDDA